MHLKCAKRDVQSPVLQQQRRMAELVFFSQPLCEAEPPVLAEYVIALLKNEAPIPEMLISCERELIDFLQEHTKVLYPHHVPQNVAHKLRSEVE